MRFKGYKLTFKINASHRTAENGSAHSHTFEFTVYISKGTVLLLSEKWRLLQERL